MKLFFFLLSLVIVIGCNQTSNLSPTKESLVQNKIKANKIESDRAKVEYNSLQQQRLNN